jgi:mono/diheme cytochrome c family protein
MRTGNVPSLAAALLLISAGLASGAGCVPPENVSIGEVSRSSEEGRGPTGAPKGDPPTYAATVVARLFVTKCVGCHGDAYAVGGVDDLFDVDALKARGIVRKTADDSPLFYVTASGHLQGATDPVTGQIVAAPTPGEVEAMRDWINSGAPPLR